MIEYRTFQNSDPPKVQALWRECQLGRGAVDGVPCDAFEALNFGQPYFDRQGVILACQGPRAVGFVHAGFGASFDQSDLDRTQGVICAVLVHPDFRRQGIGRSLIARAEDYLRRHGAVDLFAGPAEPRDPFFFGLYGGSQPAGFLESDPDAAPFFPAVGYEPLEKHAVYQRDLGRTSDPVSLRLMNIRRSTQLAIAHQRQSVSWWWITRFGRLDSVRFQLIPKGSSEPVAGVTVLGLDLYLQKWQERTIGLAELTVVEPHRRQGYGQALVLEVCRRMREELVTRVEAHTPELHPAMPNLLASSGFTRVDTGVVYRRKPD
ncbi:MAG TPA: GNAT family N-acetyltransferase [Planctomycetaceae bacterium]|nr:GNAT family N-acetyltransferase [Planctomycetaceae bacterium]